VDRCAEELERALASNEGELLTLQQAARVHACRPRPRFYLEYRDRQARKARTACGHRDFPSAKTQADELAAQLRHPGRGQAGTSTLAGLFDNYLREVTPTKGSSKQAHDRRTAALVLEILGPAECQDVPFSTRYIDGFPLAVLQLRSTGDLHRCGVVMVAVMECSFVGVHACRPSHNAGARILTLIQPRSRGGQQRPGVPLPMQSLYCSFVS
jgi:hypothetical protein